MESSTLDVAAAAPAARPASAPATATTPLRHANDLPGPRGIPVLGNALQVDTASLHRQLEKWCDEFGPYFKMRIGRRRILVVGDHEAVASILRNRPDGFSRTSRLNEIWVELGLAPGVFGANGETWKRQRRMVMAGFDPAHVKRYFPSLLQVSQRLAGRWQKAARQGIEIDLQADLMRYTVDTIAGLAFGAAVNTLESDEDVIQRHLDKLFPAVFKRLFAPLPLWRWVKTPADRRLAKSIVAVNAAVAGFVEQARARMLANPSLRERPGNLLEAMIAAADEPGRGGDDRTDDRIDDNQVAGNVLTMLLAGEDTTANTLAWMIHLLWRHPAALERAVAEVREVCGAAGADTSGELTMEQMARLDYIEACIHETMRLKPVAPIIPLQALQDITVGDVRVPAGRVVISVMRRDSVSDSHLPNAAAFDPERWLLADGGPGAQASAAKRISMPFGAGPRICPGRYLALMEMKMAMATLLRGFDIESVSTPDGKEAREHLSFTMTPVGLRMRLRERA